MKQPAVIANNHNVRQYHLRGNPRTQRGYIQSLYEVPQGTLETMVIVQSGFKERNSAGCMGKGRGLFCAKGEEQYLKTIGQFRTILFQR